MNKRNRRLMATLLLRRGGAFLPFLDAFTGSNDDPLGADWTGATWDIQGNAARGSPTAGGDLLAALNGNFADWTGDDPDHWTVSEVDGADVTQVAAGEAHADAPTLGGGLCNIYRSDDNNASMYQNVLTVGAWYQVAFDVDTHTSGIVRVKNAGGNGFSTDVYSTGSKTIIDHATHARIEFYTVVNPTDITVDNIVINALTLSTLFASVAGAGASNVTAQVKATLTAGTQAGVVACLDSAASPANFLIAYHDGTNAHLEKCVAGVYTSLIDSAAAYAAGGLVKIVKSGTSVELHYNGNKIGATQTVSDAGIISNTIHGLFSTYASNRLDDFSLTSP